MGEQIPAMWTNRRITSNMALWLALAIVFLAPGAFAFASCGTARQSATVRSCCHAHSGACCAAGKPNGSRSEAIPGNCRVSECDCSPVPIRDRAPLSVTNAEHSVPAIPVTQARQSGANSSKCLQPISSSSAAVHTVALPSSSPRAPPFQG